MIWKPFTWGWMSSTFSISAMTRCQMVCMLPEVSTMKMMWSLSTGMPPTLTVSSVAPVGSAAVAAAVCVASDFACARRSARRCFNSASCGLDAPSFRISSSSRRASRARRSRSSSAAVWRCCSALMPLTSVLIASALNTPPTTSVFDNSTSNTIAPKPQQMMSRNDRLNNSKPRRGGFMATLRPGSASCRWSTPPIANRHNSPPGRLQSAEARC